MNPLLRKLLARAYRNEEDGSGTSEGGSSAPAGDTDSSADWEAMSEGIEPGMDDNEPSESETAGTAPASQPAAKAKPQETPTTDDEQVDPNLGEEGQPADDAAPVDSDEPKPLTAEEVAAQTEALQKQYQEWEQAEIGKLEKQYGFDEETASRLLTEPELVLPRLAAQLELNATRRALEAVQRMIPQLVPQVLTSQDTEKKAADFFFGQNPDLNPKKHGKAIMEAGVMFRKLNPKATPEEAAKKIGEIVRQSLGLKAPAAGAPAPKPAGKPAPHRPAAAGATRQAAPKQQDNSVWADLASDDDD